MAHRLTRYLFPLLIFVLALALRLYHLPARAIFTADEEYQATYARTIVEDFHPIWIGVSSGDTGFYLGPYFTYFTAFWLAISGGDPLITFYIASLLGAVTAVLLYCLGHIVDSPPVGLVASLIYALSPWQIYHDQRYWNPSPVPLLSVLLLLSLYKLKSSPWWLAVIAFVCSAFWHIHLSLVPLTLVAILGIWQSRRTITARVWIVSSVIFVLMLAPLFIFDYYHNWSNLLTPYRLASRASHSFQLPPHLVSLGETLGRTLYLNPGTEPAGEIRPGHPDATWTTPSTWLVVLSFFALFIKTGNPYLTFAIFLLTLSYLFYPGPVTGYYALGLIPLYFIQLAKLFTRYRLGYVLILVFAVLSLSTLSSTNETYGYHAKRELIEDIATYLGDNSFSLSEEGTAHKYGGWRYLFTVYNKYPASSSADASLAWLYPQEIGGPSRYHVFLGATKEFEIPSDSLALYQSGGYTAVITYAK